MKIKKLLSIALMVPMLFSIGCTEIKQKKVKIIAEK